LEVIDHPQPEYCLDRVLAERGDTAFALGVRFKHRQFYLPGEPSLPLLVLFWREQTGSPILFSIVEAVQPLVSEQIAQLLERLQAPLFALDQPLRLQPVHIPKPWGQEIWYSGIEARGHSGVGDADGQIPLAWLLAALPRRFAAGNARGINLLKILDPLPDEVYGDLYFEMHEEKREVYIVTRIDPLAWPDGQGAIRFGFCREKRSEYPSDREFLAAYGAAVHKYRQVREEIDRQFDSRRAAHGYAANEPVAAATLMRWADELPADLRTQEQHLRSAMDAFSNMRPLSVGDVISVPTHTPHSLQHGVRTVEFQTPVYERKILSFAQKVLTQSHWDTSEALDRVQLDTPEQTPFLELARGEHFVCERIVDFADFTVDRIQFTAPGNYRLAAENDYRIAMVIGGDMALAGIDAPAESAWLIASGSPIEVIFARSGAALLVARPKPPAIS
jgi:hypothetical protein